MRRIRKEFGLPSQVAWISDVEPNMRDHARALESLYPGCTVLWDHNPRIRDHWVNWHMRLVHYGASSFSLIAIRRTETGQNFMVKHPPRRFWVDRDGERVQTDYQARETVETAYYVLPDGDEPGGWVVIR